MSDTETFSKRERFTIARHITRIWFGLFTLNSLCTVLAAALVGKKWSLMDGQDRFIIVVLVIGNWTNLIMAWLSTAAAKVARGELPLNGTAPADPPPKP